MAKTTPKKNSAAGKKAAPAPAPAPAKKEVAKKQATTAAAPPKSKAKVSEPVVEESDDSDFDDVEDDSDLEDLEDDIDSDESDDIDADDVDDEDDEEDEEAQPAHNPKQHSYNERAMRTLLAEIALPGDLHWTETLDITSAEPAEVADSNDDLGREHAFITMALAAARIGRKRVLDSGAPFARPDDYFAEMIKSDAHMTKVRQSLINEAQSIKASEEAKRQRELRKFGKKMQQTKLLERQKSKSSELEKIKEFKKKRRGQDVGDDHGNDFDVEIDSAFADTPSGSGNNKRGRDNGGGGAASAAKRQKRDQKYGFGGKKRHSKSNTRESLDAPYLNSGKGGKGGAGNKRPGKAKRQAAQNRR